MKSFFLLLLTTLLLTAGYSQSDKQENLQSRTVAAFHGISVSGGIDLYLSAGTQSVAVGAASAEYRDHIKTDIENGILRIYVEKGFRVPEHARLRAFVSLTGLDRLSASGGSDTYLQTEIAAKDLRINLSGGSDLKGRIKADELDIQQSGGSDVNLAGTVKKLNLQSSGGSDLKGYDLAGDDVTISASGGSDSYLTVNHALTVDASGGSDVFYKGTAAALQIKSSGGGSVVKKD